MIPKSHVGQVKNLRLERERLVPRPNIETAGDVGRLTRFKVELGNDLRAEVRDVEAFRNLNKSAW